MLRHQPHSPSSAALPHCAFAADLCRLESQHADLDDSRRSTTQDIKTDTQGLLRKWLRFLASAKKLRAYAMFSLRGLERLCL